MDTFHIVILLAGLIGVAGIGAIAYVFMGSSGNRGVEMRGLLGNVQQQRNRFEEDPVAHRQERQSQAEIDILEIKKRSQSQHAKRGKEDITTKLFKAGFYSAEDRRRFKLQRIITPIVSTLGLGFGAMYAFHNPLLTSSSFVLGAFIGFAMPLSMLERAIRYREEETMYFLPLVIEQIAIGVSSSLDIGPCISNILQMANERDSHNPVTEMFIHVEKLIRSGLNLEDALVEVGETNGMTDVKHAFMFLSQCAKHGGEISKQLQELADAVMVQRQVQVEARITSLPVKATGPLAMVFAGFFALLFAGLLVRLMSAFGGAS